MGDDDRLLVKPPKELEQLRVPGSAVTKAVPAGGLECGQRMAMGLSNELVEVTLTLRWTRGAASEAAVAAGRQQAGIYLLGGGVTVGYEPLLQKLVLNATNATSPPKSWGNASRFQASPSAVNVSVVNDSVSFRVYQDKIVVEVFEERGRAAITQVTAPIAVSSEAATAVGIYLECGGGGEEERAMSLPSFEATAWQLRPAPVRTSPTDYKSDDETPVQLEWCSGGVCVNNALV